MAEALRWGCHLVMLRDTLHNEAEYAAHGYPECRPPERMYHTWYKLVFLRLKGVVNE